MRVYVTRFGHLSDGEKQGHGLKTKGEIAQREIHRYPGIRWLVQDISPDAPAGAVL
jgi:hypothetical protein